MAYFTERELLERYEYYAIQLENQLLQGEEFHAISDQLPIVTHLSDPQTFEIIEANKSYIQSSGYEVEEVQEDWMEYVMSTIHPASAQSILSFLPSFFKTRNPNQTISFIEYARLFGQTGYSPLLVFTKPSKLPGGTLLWLAVDPKNFEKSSKKVEQIIKMDEFKLKHFKRFQSLTNREVEILKLLANGYNNPQIAEKLFLSRSTVETHRKNLKRKLELKSLRDLMRYAFAFDLVEV